MEQSKLKTQQEEPLTSGRKVRLIMGWVFIAFAVWILGYTIYLLLSGESSPDALVPISSIMLFIGGGTLLRSKPDDSRKRLK